MPDNVTRFPTHQPPPWWMRLRAPFPTESLAYKPQPLCGACGKHPDRCCGQHKKERCPVCRQYLTTAHIDLPYVGHAETTGRLIEVDPQWDWEPAYHDVDRDVLMAAIATGSAEIVAQVIENAPPLFDQHGGMWMRLTVHDDSGHEVTRLGYGDAQGKYGTNAVKETIGDGIRNAGMRFGMALDLWSRSDAALEVYGLADENSNGRKIKPAGRRGKQAASEDGKPAEESDGQEAGEQPEGSRPPGSPVAQALAQLALQIAATGTLDQLGDAVYNQARRRNVLGEPVNNPFGEGVVKLSDVITEAKSRIEGDVKAAEDQP